MRKFRFPRLIGNREQFAALLTDQQVPASLTGELVVALCRDLLVASPTVADEVVRDLIGRRGAAEVALIGAPEQFVADVKEAAGRHGFPERVFVGDPVLMGI